MLNCSLVAPAQKHWQRRGGMSSVSAAFVSSWPERGGIRSSPALVAQIGDDLAHALITGSCVLVDLADQIVIETKQAIVRIAHGGGVLLSENGDDRHFQPFRAFVFSLGHAVAFLKSY
jgi:hypothetical protein